MPSTNVSNALVLQSKGGCGSSPEGDPFALVELSSEFELVECTQTLSCVH